MTTVAPIKRMLISADDEAAVTDIRIAPDGRVFVFGTSRPVLEMLNELGWGDAAVAARIQACSPGPCGLGDSSNEKSTDPQGVGLHDIDQQESAP